MWHRRYLLTLLSIVFCCASSSAQTYFEPSLSASAWYTNQVGVTEGDSEGSALAVLALPLRRTSPRSELELGLTTYYRWFETTEAFDDYGTDFTLALHRRTSERNSFDLGLLYGRAQQAAIRPLEQPSLALRPRYRRERWGGSLGWSRHLTERWSFSVSGAGASSTFESLVSDTPGGGPEDRDDFGATLSLDRAYSERGSIGWFYRYWRYELDISASQDTHTTGVALKRQTSEHSTLDLSLGVYLAEALDDVPGIDPDDSEETGGYGALQYTLEGESTQFSVDLNHGIDASDPFLGVSTRTMLGLSLQDPRPEMVVQWRVSSRFERFEELGGAAPAFETVSLGLDLGFRLSRRLALRLAAGGVHQLSPDIENPDFIEGGMALAWFPLTNTRLGVLGG